MVSVVIGSKGKVSVHSKEAYKKYRNSFKTFDSEIDRQKKYAKVVRAFYTKIAEKMVESEGGVFIDNLGYFTIMELPFIEVAKAPYAKEGIFNFHTNNKTYHPMFIPVAKNKALLNVWSLDRTFSRRKVKGPLSKALKNKKKYKTFMGTLYSLYKLK